MGYGCKYNRTMIGLSADGSGTTAKAIVDIYDILDAFDVRCPARQHAIKKLLCAGQRGEKSTMDDLVEAKAAVERAIELSQILT